MPNSDLWALRLPALNGETPDVPLAFARLATDLEATLGGRGLFADKPTSTSTSPGRPGRRWFATDHKMEYLDTGTGWTPIGPAYVGDLKMAVRTDDHDAWLRCDGRELAATYTDLVALLIAQGRPFGSGANGRPKLPDPAGRALMAAGSGSGLTARAIGAAGGAETVALSTAEMPNHSHGVNDPGHNHGGATDQGAADRPYPGYGSGTPNEANSTYGNTGYMSVRAFGGRENGFHTHGIPSGGTGVSLQAAGSGNAHQNMSPFLAVGSLFIRA